MPVNTNDISTAIPKKPLLSPKNDYVFKRIFGSKNSQPILKNFLLAVLDLPESDYDFIQIENPFLEKEYAGDKLGILDVKLHTKSGAIIDIEIQMKSIVSTFKKRIAFYGSKLISSQMSSGEDYSRLDRVICITITDFVLLEENDVYHNRFFLYDKNTGATLTDILEIDTLEMPKLPEIFTATDEKDLHLQQWMRFLSEPEEEKMTELALKNDGIGEALAVLREMSNDEREREIAFRRDMLRMDIAVMQREAIESGLAEGLEKGLAEGMEKGLTEGREEGREEEREKHIAEKLESARTMKQDGVAPASIAKYTGLSVSEIGAL